MNFSIPAYLSDFSTLDDQRTIAKLKVFFVGETGDGRVFTKEFSEELVKSLPYTPVVAFYSDLKDDFIGHNGTQYIYGIVRPDAKYGFETDEDGTEWFITEVMLYTDRIDNIGEVSKKIVGCKHSLEMSPDSVEYEVFKDNGKTKVRFTKARLCGLSVLGEDQKPAFTGSEFFAENDDLRERFENFFSFLTNKDRGATMDKKEIFAQYVNFIKLTYNEKQAMINEYAQQQYGDNYGVFVADMADDYAVLGVFSFETWKTEYKMFDYNIDEQGVVLENERACFQRFVTIDQINKIENATVMEDLPFGTSEVKKEEDFAKKDGEEEDKKEEDNKDSDTDSKDKKDTKDDEEEEDKKDKKEVYTKEEKVKDETLNPTFTEGDSDEQQKEETAKLQKAKHEESKENFTTSTPELTDSERRELEAFRQEKKLNLVNSYKDELPAETITSYEEMAATCDYETLEAKLAIEFRKFSKQNKNNAAVFSFNNVVNVQTTATTYADLVKAALNK